LNLKKVADCIILEVSNAGIALGDNQGAEYLLNYEITPGEGVEFTFSILIIVKKNAIGVFINMILLDVITAFLTWNKGKFLRDF